MSRDRSQHLASELLANLPEPDSQPVGVGWEALLAELPEPAGRRAHGPLADDLLAELPDPIDDRTLADDVAEITARLDRLQQREPPSVGDGLGIDPVTHLRGETEATTRLDATASRASDHFA